MLSIAIYSDQQNDTELLRAKIQDYLLQNKIGAKVILFDNYETFITAPDSFDIYFMDMECSDDVISLGRQMMSIDNQSYFVYYSSDISKAYDCFKIRANYFLRKPIDPEDVIEVLNHIRKEIKKDIIIIKTAQGERRVFINQLNYINIIKRNLCYHLCEGEVFDGQMLRGSFEKAITPLQNHPSLLFLSPSLLINMENIKVLSSDHAIFDNDDIVYFPKKSYDLVNNRWKKNNGI